MSSGRTDNYDFPYPLDSDPVNVASDIEELAKSLDSVLNSGFSPDLSVPNVLYVSKAGNDENNGRSPDSSFLTISAAAANATSGSIIFVKSGTYTENNPINIPQDVSVVGDSLATVFVIPSNTSENIFYINSGVFVNGITFKNHISPAAAISFNPDGSTGSITTTPRIKNCASETTTGKGIYLDGSVASGYCQAFVESFTQNNQGGIGVHIENNAYAQLSGIYTLCCDIGISCTNGGRCLLKNSNCSFGNYGLKAQGTQFIQSGSTNRVDQTGDEIIVDGLSSQPSPGNAVSFDNGTTFYTVVASTEVLNTQSTITLSENVSSPIPNDTTTNFYVRSEIQAFGQTFEYVGSGTTLAAALPQSGGEAIAGNEVLESSGGRVLYNSIDQLGNMKIGNGLTINSTSGTIVGDAYERDIIATVTPYILALEG